MQGLLIIRHTVVVQLNSSFPLPLPSFPKGMTSHFIIPHMVVQLNSSFRLPLPSFPKGMTSHFIIPHTVVQLNSSFVIRHSSFVIHFVEPLFDLPELCERNLSYYLTHNPGFNQVHFRQFHMLMKLVLN